MTKNQLMEIPLKQFGLPDVRKFPMPDEKHLRAAIAYFHTAKPNERKELAANIIRRHKQLGSTVKISKRNPLYEYVPNEMKKLNESAGLISLTTLAAVHPLLNEDAKAILETLISKDNLRTVDDLDSAVPDDYTNKLKLLGTLKSFIINEDMPGEEFRRYPAFYNDYKASNTSLHLNNGGLNESSRSILLAYNGSLNEAAYLGPVQNFHHVQFAIVLREWNEHYVNGLRNPVYDRLMIESWKSYGQSLTEAYSTSGSLEDKQRLLDIGYLNLECDGGQAQGNIFAPALTITQTISGGEDDEDTSYYDHSVANSADN